MTVRETVDDEVQAYTIEEGAQWISTWRHLALNRRFYWGLGGALERERLHRVGGPTLSEQDERVLGLVAGLDTRRTHWLSEGPSQGLQVRLFAETSHGLHACVLGRRLPGGFAAALPARPHRGVAALERGLGRVRCRAVPARRQRFRPADPAADPQPARIRAARLQQRRAVALGTPRAPRHGRMAHSAQGHRSPRHGAAGRGESPRPEPVLRRGRRLAARRRAGLPPRLRCRADVGTARSATCSAPTSASASPRAATKAARPPPTSGSGAPSSFWRRSSPAARGR